MRKKIYTADEEMRGVPELALFAVVWYSILIRDILAGGFHSSLLIFLVGGIFVPVQAVRTVQKALYNRRFHAQCMQDGYPMQGRIVNITKEYYYEYDSRNRSRRTTCYFLIVEIVNPDTGIVQTIKSEAYRIPIYRYLGSPYVQVYTDPTGWKHVIDGFQFKASRHDPDIPLEDSNVYLKDFHQPSILFRVIFMIVLILMLLQAAGILR